MDTRHVTPTDVAVFTASAPLSAPDHAEPPTRTERFLRSPAQFWTATIALLLPAGAFWTSAFLHEVGRTQWANWISDILFDPGHSIVRGG